MAGQFLNIEEAAARLGVTEADVRQLVDQRKISALRDTSGQKFRADDLDRYLSELAEEQDNSGVKSSHDTPEIALEAPATASQISDSGLSLDGLELDLEPDKSSPASVVIQDSLDDQDVAASKLSDSKPEGHVAEEPISLILDDDIELASGPSLPVGQTGNDEAEASLVIGDDIGDSDVGGTMDNGPATMAGGDDKLAVADNSGLAGSDLASAPSVIASSDAGIDIEGLDMSLAGDLSSVEPSDNDGLESPASVAPENEAQSLVVADSFAGDLDLESLVAASGVDDLASVVASDPASAPGSGLFGQDSGADDIGSGILVDSDPGSNADPGGQLSNVDMEGGLSLEGDEVKPWAVDLGEFLNDAEDDAHAATMLGTADQFDLDHEASGEDASQSADLASASGAGDSSMFAKSAGPGDSSFFGQELDDGPTGLTHGSEMLSSSQYGFGIDTTTFDGWQLTGLICCAVLLLVGGLLTFDLVRTIGSAGDTTIAKPLAGGLAQVFGWTQ